MDETETTYTNNRTIGRKCETHFYRFYRSKTSRNTHVNQNNLVTSELLLAAFNDIHQTWRVIGWHPTSNRSSYSCACDLRVLQWEVNGLGTFFFDPHQHPHQLQDLQSTWIYPLFLSIIFFYGQDPVIDGFSSFTWPDPSAAAQWQFLGATFLRSAGSFPVDEALWVWSWAWSCAPSYPHGIHPFRFWRLLFFFYQQHPLKMIQKHDINILKHHHQKCFFSFHFSQRDEQQN